MDVATTALDEALITRGLVEVSPDAVIIRAIGRVEDACAWPLSVVLSIRKKENAQNKSSRGSLQAAIGEHRLNDFIRGTLNGLT